MDGAQRRRQREERRRREREREERRRRRETRNVAEVRNEAENGTTSGILNINLQIPIQVGANAQNVQNSDNVSTTVI